MSGAPAGSKIMARQQIPQHNSNQYAQHQHAANNNAGVNSVNNSNLISASGGVSIPKSTLT